MKPKFSSGDKVFAKVRGYPPWPARVEGLADETPNKMKYHVYFYGTGETAVVKAEDICSYVHNKVKLGKTKKTKNFLEAVVQIEDELSSEEKQILNRLENSPNETLDSSQSEESSGSKRASGAGKPRTPSSAAKPKAKDKKKKTDDSGTDESDVRKNRSSNVSEPVSVSKKETEVKKTSSEETDSKNPEVLSRSGRKIKKKIFADFEGESVEEGVPPTSAIVGNKNQALMKNKNADKSTTKDDDYIIAYVDHEKIKLPVTKYRPNFEHRCDSVNWTVKVKTYALFLKERLETGKMSPKEAEESLEMYAKQRSKNSEFNFEVLKTETKLLDLDVSLRSALNYNNPNLNKSLEILDKMADLRVTALMLKKHPDVVTTIKKIRRYIGPETLEDDQEIKEKIALVRKKGEFILSKFQSLFFIPQYKTFWEVFHLHQERFDVVTKNMPNEEFASLVEDPEDAVPLF